MKEFERKTSSLPGNYIAGIIAVILFLYNWWLRWGLYTDLQSPYFMVYMIVLLGFVFVAAGAFTRIPSLSGAGLVLLGTTWLCYNYQIIISSFFREYNYYRVTFHEYFVIFVLLIATISLYVAAMTTFKPKSFGKIGVLPAILFLVFTILDQLRILFMGFYSFAVFRDGVVNILTAAMILFITSWSISEEKQMAHVKTIGNIDNDAYMPPFSADNDSNGSSQISTNGENPEGYISMMTHILLLFVSCGIWLYVWIYKTAAYVAKESRQEQSSPGVQLLLCMFIPFYMIYWIYKRSQDIDYISKERGVPSDISTICLITAIFVPVVPPILMQDKINAIAKASCKELRTDAGTDDAMMGNPDNNNTVSLAKNKAAESKIQYEKDPYYDFVVVQPNMSSGTVQDESNTVEELKKYKEIYDMGIITEEEFEKKKKYLLNL